MIFVVGEFVEIYLFGVLGRADCDTHGAEEVGDFLVVENLVVHGFLDIEDFASEWEDCLECTVAALLGGTACRVTLDDEEFAVFSRAA